MASNAEEMLDEHFLKIRKKAERMLRSLPSASFVMTGSNRILCAKWTQSRLYIWYFKIILVKLFIEIPPWYKLRFCLPHRIESTFYQFLCSSATEEEDFKGVTPPDSGKQDQNGDTSVHGEYSVQAEDDGCSNDETKPIEHIKQNPKNASINSSNQIIGESQHENTFSSREPSLQDQN